MLEEQLDRIMTNNKEDSLKQLNLSVRGLTSGEIMLAKSVYKDTIDYSFVKIIWGSYFPFDLQNEDTFVAPNGNIFVPTKHYFPDYSKQDASYQHTFIHEMGHVWQHQRKNNVLVSAGVAQACSIFKNPYKYNIHGADTPAELIRYKNNKKFVNYNLEAQAEIFADYWALKTKKTSTINSINWHNLNKIDLEEALSIYEKKISEVIK